MKAQVLIVFEISRFFFHSASDAEAMGQIFILLFSLLRELFLADRATLEPRRENIFKLQVIETLRSFSRAEKSEKKQG